MSKVIIYYEARCKHCLYCTTRVNTRKRNQAYCAIKEEFITLRDKACENLEL